MISDRMATKSYPTGLKHQEATKADHLGLDENSSDDVEVNIAVFGKSGSGRSSFVNAILGLDKKDRKSARPGEGAEMTSKDEKPISYSHPENPQIRFSILRSLDSLHIKERSLKGVAKSIPTVKFDAFLIFTAEEFTAKLLLILQEIAPSKKPFFLIKTGIDKKLDSEKGTKKVIVDAIRSNLKKSMVKNAKKGSQKMKGSESLHCDEYEIYLINNHNPYEWDYLKLVKAIADVLPSPQKKSFIKIPMVQESIALTKFHHFLKEIEAREKNVTKVLPSMDEIKQLFVASGIVGVQRMMNEKLDRWKDVVINLAILGNSGAGKSSFINALRGVNDDDDQKAAKTGVVEMTRVPTPFEHITNPNIRFWDLPGIGTVNYPNLSIFCEKVFIEKYDTFLIICSKRFTENDLQLAKKVESMGKSFFFVRTKIDNDIRSEKRKKAFNEEKVLNEIRQDCVKNLENFKFGEDNIFLVSNHHPKMWDFNRLEKAIVDQLPTKQKESLTLSMRTNSEDMLSEKIKMLKGRTWMVAAASIVTKLFGPFSLIIDGKLIRNQVKVYSKQMEFPDSDSEEFTRLSEDLQKKVKKFFPRSDDDLLQWLKSFDGENVFNIRMHKKMILTEKPLMFVYSLLNSILDEMEKTASDILCEAAIIEGDDESSDSD